jgi:hypothetical protein
VRFISYSLIACSLQIGLCTAQDLAKNELRVSQAPSSAGLRHYSPGEWGIVKAEISNQGDAPGEALLTSYFDQESTVQYGRRFWVPAHSRRSSWYPILPPGKDSPVEERYDLKSLQFNSDAHGTTAVKQSDERLLKSTWLSAKHRGYVTGMIDDADVESGAAQYELAVALRTAHGMSRDVSTFHDQFLPATPLALEGMDQLLICSDRPARDVAGLAAIRHWLMGGGRLWIMLDQVSPETASLIAEEAFDCIVVDRVGLTDVAIQSVKGKAANPTRTEFEEPVDFVRVLPGSANVTHMVNGWPAAFWQPVGRGRVFYTTLGARGWLRLKSDDKEEDELLSGAGGGNQNPSSSKYVATDELTSIGGLFLSAPKPLPIQAKQLRPVLTQQIGYKIVSRKTLLSLLTVFCLVLLGAGLVLAKRKRLELLGLLGPAFAVGIAATIIVLGAQSRRAVPNTLAEIQIVESSPGSENLNVQGVAAIFNRDSSDAVIGTTSEGLFVPDSTGLAGRVRRMVWTDMDKWHFENLSLPAGVRFAPFKVPVRYADQVSARASFGSDGLKGRVTRGPFASFSDAVITTQAGQTAVVHFDDPSDSETLSVNTSDVLPPGEFVSRAFLSDQQRRRQDVYRQLVPGADESTPFPQVPTFMAWAPRLDLGFDFPDQEVQKGSALVLAPLSLDRSPPGTNILIPSPFLPYRMDSSRNSSLAYSNTNRQWLARKRGAKTWLRVQFPGVVLPLEVESMTVTLHVKGPVSKLELAGLIEGEATILATREDPIGTLNFILNRPEAMQLDKDGGLLLGVFVAGVEDDKSDSKEFDGGTNKWSIEYLRIEARGKTLQPQNAYSSGNK